LTYLRSHNASGRKKKVIVLFRPAKNWHFNIGTVHLGACILKGKMSIYLQEFKVLIFLSPAGAHTLGYFLKKINRM